MVTITVAAIDSLNLVRVKGGGGGEEMVDTGPVVGAEVVAADVGEDEGAEVVGADVGDVVGADVGEVEGTESVVAGLVMISSVSTPNAAVAALGLDIAFRRLFFTALADASSPANTVVVTITDPAVFETLTLSAVTPFPAVAATPRLNLALSKSPTSPGCLV